ncbi:MAG TPA: helix-turn-helix transcriptional regulator [Micromonospora sp.]
MIALVKTGKPGTKKIGDEDRARGQRIRDVRLSLGMTQLEFARFVGRGTDQTVSRWELGETTPSAQDLAILENKTGTPVGYILQGEGSSVAAPEVLIEFFKSPAGERLTGEQRRGLIMLLRDQDVDAYRIRAALDLLMPPRSVNGGR